MHISIRLPFPLHNQLPSTMIVDEDSMPLLAAKPPKKLFYRARALWLIPFAIFNSLTRTMSSASRLEVFAQLSCNTLYGHYELNQTHFTSTTFSSDIPNISLNASISSLEPNSHLSTLLPDHAANNSESDDTQDRHGLPSICASDPAVQAGAARLHATMTTTIGVLSVFTAGWWGSFGERHGRKKVLALPLLGLFITDLVFIFVSTPSSPLSKFGFNLLIASSIIEGLLGGHSMPQSAISAYLSDCTSSGSRAHIFSRFTGVTYVGSSVGPVIGGWLIRHPLKWVRGSSIPGRQPVTSVFWVSVFFAFINSLLVIFVVPESLDKEKRKRAMIAYQKLGKVTRKKGKARESSSTLLLSRDPDRSSSDDDDATEQRNRPSQEERGCGLRTRAAEIISRLLNPLAVFLPAVVLDPLGTGRQRRDWSLTLLTAALFGFMLSTGITHMMYLYGRHVYEWSVEQLSYYISFMGVSRAIFLLFLLPAFISFFKPKSLPSSNQKGKGRPLILSDSSDTDISTVQHPPEHQSQPEQQPGAKPKPTRAQLGREITFDLLLARFSLMVDILSQTLVILFPAPSLKVNTSSLMQTAQDWSSFSQRQAMFVVATSFSSVGSGMEPAVHSLALCMLQVRELESNVDGEDTNGVETREGGAGGLFGAFAVLHTIAEMILAPMIFGFTYSATVAMFPKAIFILAAAFLGCALTLVFCVTNPVQPGYSGQSRREQNIERGRRSRSRSRSTVEQHPLK